MSLQHPALCLLPGGAEPRSCVPPSPPVTGSSSPLHPGGFAGKHAELRHGPAATTPLFPPKERPQRARRLWPNPGVAGAGWLRASDCGCRGPALPRVGVAPPPSPGGRRAQYKVAHKLLISASQCVYRKNLPVGVPTHMHPFRCVLRKRAHLLTALVKLRGRSDFFSPPIFVDSAESLVRIHLKPNFPGIRPVSESLLAFESL